jgi:hypothetical protein
MKRLLIFFLLLIPSIIEAKTLIISNTTPVSTDLSIASTIAVQVENGGRLDIDAGKTLTIVGPTSFPLSQVFTGTGLVRGLKLSYPEYFGAVGSSVTDDLTAVTASIDALSDGGILHTSKMFYISPLTLDSIHNAGITFEGESGEEVKNANSPTGFAAFTNQAHIIKIGDLVDAVGVNVNRVHFKNFTIFGNDKTITKAALWIYRSSQGSMSHSSIWRTKGTGLYVNYFEDWHIYNSRFTCLTNGILFGDSLGTPPNNWGTNAVNIGPDNRFEFIDTTYLGTDPTATDPWASRVYFFHNKLEVGGIIGVDNTNGDYDYTADYGSATATVCPINFSYGNTSNWRVDVNFNENWIAGNGIGASVPLFWLGRVSGFKIEHNTFAINDSNGTLFLLRIADSTNAGVSAPGIIVRDNSQIATQYSAPTRTITTDIWNFAPMVFEYPLDGSAIGEQSIVNEHRDNFLPMSQYSTKFTTDYAAARMVPNPTSNDRAISITNSVLKLSDDLTVTFLYLSEDLLAPNWPGIGGATHDGILKLGIRLKKDSFAGTGTIQVRFGEGGNIWDTITTTSETYEWKYSYINVRNKFYNTAGAKINDSLRLTYVGDADERVVYVDGITLDWVDTSVAADEPEKGVWIKGDLARDDSGASVGWACSTAGGAQSGTRTNNTAYTAGNWKLWSTGTTVWECTSAGTSHLTTAPSIAGKVVGDTVVDGTVTWTLRSLTTAAFTSL